jgi:hypothetical protein
MAQRIWGICFPTPANDGPGWRTHIAGNFVANGMEGWNEFVA